MIFLSIYLPVRRIRTMEGGFVHRKSYFVL